MRISIILALAAIAASSPVSAQVAVQGYVKRDGTYVSPHIRTAPNGTTADNYSTWRR